MTRPVLVVTSIFGPTATMVALAEGSDRARFEIVVIGDSKSPSDYQLPGATFYSVQAQRDLGFRLGELAPVRHYARKNVGYLLAARQAVPYLIETDDDNLPRPEFFGPRDRKQYARSVAGAGWVNVYRYFTDAAVWPRGLPLSEVRKPVPELATDLAYIDCPIQQGLADVDPDVDAIYRLVGSLPLSFERDLRVGLGAGSWCPFNSQNTTWFPDAFPLMYLPFHCSFRMTDIWRGFVAQRIAWENGWSVLFHSPTVWQERNDHDLMRDFEEEVPGYLNNSLIARELESLELAPGLAALGDNLMSCYDRLVALELVGPEELTLLEAWNSDFQAIRS